MPRILSQKAISKDSKLDLAKGNGSDLVFFPDKPEASLSGTVAEIGGRGDHVDFRPPLSRGRQYHGVFRRREDSEQKRRRREGVELINHKNDCNPPRIRVCSIRLLGD